MTVRIWLLRHGQTGWNAEHRFTGWTDVPLSQAGREEAERARRLLSGRRFDAVWSSDLCRAVETARIVVGEPRQDRRLREMDFGALEGRTWNELDEDTHQALLAFDGFACPGGESIDDMRRRLVSFLEELPPGDHLIVTHGGVVRLLARECGSDGFPRNAEMVALDWSSRAAFVPDT